MDNLKIAALGGGIILIALLFLVFFTSLIGIMIRILSFAMFGFFSYLVIIVSKAIIEERKKEEKIKELRKNNK